MAIGRMLQICQSLIQKAVRRGDEAVTRKVVMWLHRNGHSEWLRRRLAVITFEECWTYGLKVTFPKNPTVITAHFAALARTVKNKNACGLGSQAYHLSTGDESVFTGDTGDTDILLIAHALRRPKNFLAWASRQAEQEDEKLLVSNAGKAFKLAEEPWDKAFILAAAYLAVTRPIPETTFTTKKSRQTFPYWIAIDRHTADGRKAMQQAVKKINVGVETALWLAFYFEGVICQSMVKSAWWDRQRRWRMKSLGLTLTEANRLWKKIKPGIALLLKPEASLLKREIE